MKLTIDRKIWLRGEGSGPSKLLRDDGKMCCLGFLGLQCGYGPDQLTGKPTPYSGFTGKPTPYSGFGGALWPAELLNDYDLTYQLMRVNDALIGRNVIGNHEFVPLVDDADREARLTELFKKAGIEVEFVGGKSYKTIGDVFNLSRARIRQMFNRAIRHIRFHYHFRCHQDKYR